MKRSLVLALVLFTACGGDDSSSYVGPPVPQALVVAGDFAMTGLMSKLDLTTMEVAQNVGGAGTVAGDPVIRRVDDRVYVINRGGGNSVTIFDATTLDFLDQFGTGEGSNPQDVARIGDDLYVPSLGTAGIVKIDAKTGKTTTIDLAAVGDPDGQPDCVSAIAVGSKVYVACGLLDENYSARGNGVVAVIDADSDKVTSTVELPTPNPYNFMMHADNAFGGDVLIPLLPRFNDYSTGCVARLTTGSAPKATCAAGLSNAQLGGTIIHMDLSPDGQKLWMAVGTLDSNFMNPTGTLKSFDATSGAVTSVSPNAQMIQDVAACADGSVVAVDGTFSSSGLRVYSGTVEMTSMALPIGLPPTFGNAAICYGGG
jgi:DNA-binding beta-propeller fold protein YncE